MNSGLSFDALFRYADEECSKWSQWFEQNPSALDVKVDIANMGDARGMVRHVFAVEQLYVSRMLKEPTIAPDQLPQDTKALFKFGEDARAKLRAIVASKDDAALDQTITFMTRLSGEVTASYRKCIAQALTHGIRHWAQLATVLRQAGFKQPWSHDFLQSSAMK